MTAREHYVSSWHLKQSLRSKTHEDEFQQFQYWFTFWWDIDMSEIYKGF